MAEISINKKALQILNALYKKDVSKDEFLKSLDIKSSIFYRYIKDLKDAGFEIEVKNKIYHCTRYQEAISISKNEISILIYMLLLANTILPEYKSRFFKKFIICILSLGHKSEAELFFKKYNQYKKIITKLINKNKIAVLSDYIKEKKEIRITVNSKKSYTFIPRDFSIKNNKMYVNYIDKNQKLKSKELTSIIKLDEINSKNKKRSSKETIFELSGKLSKTYLLKEDERVIDFQDDTLTIASSNPNKEMLFRRLLRYDTLCKVLLPKEDVRDFKLILKKSLDNIEGVLDNI